MKKVFKIIGWAFLALIIVGNIGRLLGRSAYENSIATQVQRANQDCGTASGRSQKFKLRTGMSRTILTIAASIIIC